MKLTTVAEKFALLYVNHLLEKETVDQFDEWLDQLVDADEGMRDNVRTAFYTLCRHIKEME